MSSEKETTEEKANGYSATLTEIIEKDITTLKEEKKKVWTSLAHAMGISRVSIFLREE